MQLGDVKEAVADITKAQKELGFKPKTSIQEGVPIFIKWFLEEQDWLMKLEDGK